MKRTINEHEFRDAFRECGRGDQFSYDALGLLFEYFDDLDDQCGTETELDVIAICCDFSEETWESIADNYGIDTSHCEDESEALDEVKDYLCDHGFGYVGVTNDEQIVYQTF